MPHPATLHGPDLAHHVQQGQAWLARSSRGAVTTAVSFAALELRYAIERLAIHYWRTLLGRALEPSDLRDTESFKRIERRIYELAGHQREINAHFEFMREFLSALKADVPLHTPDLGKLARHWDYCSEFCHIGWPLSSHVREQQVEAAANLGTIAAELQALVESAGWPTIHDARVIALRNGYVRGESSLEDLRTFMREVGVWAKVEYPNGRPSEFVGEPIPPRGGPAS
jgi:hypothetical protein